MLTSRYTAPEGLLAQFAGSLAPLAPPGGWLGAVVEAIEVRRRQKSSASSQALRPARRLFQGELWRCFHPPD